MPSRKQHNRARGTTGRREVKRMEAEHKESQGLKMNPNASIRKPLRARKTMTPSSRKQVELLRNLHELRRAGSSNYSVDNYVQLKVIGTERLNYKSPKETDPDLESKETLAKEPVAKLVVNSEISIYNSSPEASRGLPYNGCSADTNMKQFLNAGSLQDLLLNFYEKEPDSQVSKPVEVLLYSKPTSQPLDRSEEHKPASRPSGRLEEQTAPRASFASDTPTLGKTKKAEGTPENPALQVLKQELQNFRFRKGNPLPDDTSRERRTSGRKEEVSCKRVTSSNETGVASTTETDRSQSGLEKVRCLIQRHVKNLKGDLDHKLRQLNERVDRTQCLQKHEEMTMRIIKKISRLDRHVNSIANHQRDQLSKKVNPPSPQPKATILNVPRPLPESPNNPPMPLKRRSEEPSEVPSKTAKSSATETSCLHVETSGVQASNSADVQQKKESSNAQISVEAPRTPKTKFLIDLTEEEDTKPEKVLVKANPPSESTTSKPPQPTIELLEEVPMPFPHLPPLPKIHLHPQHMNGFRDTLPPQKLELAVAQIQNPKGIALQWNITEADPRCAPIESFHLFICLENKTAGTRSRWIKTNEIKAMSLPMACSLSQFAAAGNCYFAMQSRDIFGRFGPFCDIQSISTA